MDTPFGVGGGNFRILTQSGYVDTVGTPMYPRSVFERIGLFDEALIRNQDDELNYRITKAGGKIFLDIAMHVKYEVRASLSNLYRQYFQYGYWKVYVNRKHNTITTLRQLIPAIFVFVVTTCWLPGLIMPRLFWFYGGLLLLYLLAAKWFTFRKVEQWHHFFIYMLCFFTLHFAYGFGYLKGIFHFLILRKKSGEESQTMLSR
jgi:GT2 family glycosyltransferase